MQIADGFNPGFNRQKLSLLELANSNGGLDPIEYLYAGDVSFESVLASYVKGGMFDINMLYVINIDANDIQTNTIEANTATVGTIYVKEIKVDNIDADTIHVDDLYADNVTIYDDLTVGKLSSSATATFHTSFFEIYNVGLVEIATGSFSMESAGFITMTSPGYISIAAPVGIISINTPLFEINPIESSIVPLGLVGIYSGGSISMSAPVTIIGAPARFGAQPATLTLNALELITIGNQTLNSPAVLNILGLETNMSAQALTIITRTTNIDTTGICNLVGGAVMNITAATDLNLRATNGAWYGYGTSMMLLTAANMRITSGGELTMTTTRANISMQSAVNASINSADSISLKAGGKISVDCPETMIPTPIGVQGEGALASDTGPVAGDMDFELLNMVQCIDGVLKTVDITVNITIAG